MYKLVVLSAIVAVVVARTRYLNNAEHTSAYSSSVATPTAVSRQSRVDIHRTPLISTTYAAPDTFGASVAVVSPVATPSVHSIVTHGGDSDDVYSFRNHDNGNIHDNQVQDRQNVQDVQNVRNNQNNNINNINNIVPDNTENQSRNTNFENQGARVNSDMQVNFDNQSGRINYDNRNAYNNFDSGDLYQLSSIQDNQNNFHIRDGQLSPNDDDASVFRDVAGQDFHAGVAPIVRTFQAHRVRTISSPLGHSVDSHDSHSLATHDIQPVVSRDGLVQPGRSSVRHSARLDVHQSASLVSAPVAQLSLDANNPTSAPGYESTSPAW